MPVPRQEAYERGKGKTMSRIAAWFVAGAVLSLLFACNGEARKAAREPAPAKAQPAQPSVVLPAGAVGTPKEAGADTPKAETAASKWAPAVKPKPLSENTRRGLAWLVRAQHPDGSWGQGEESAQMGNSMEKIAQSANVADSCLAALALIRAGSTPGSGEQAAEIRKALEFVCKEIEQADAQSLFITNLKGTRTQAKLGQFADTFMASMLLAEARHQMPDEASRKRVAAAFHKVMDKIEKNQKADGTWDGQGWAPVLQQSLAAKGINRAAQSGLPVDERVRERAEKFAGDHFETVNADRPSSAPSVRLKAPEAAAASGGSAAFADGGGGAGGTAGVELYGFAGNLSAMQDQENTNAARETHLRDELAQTTASEKKKEIQTTLDRYEANRKQLKEVKTALVQRLDDTQFIQGFGSNGGEEFLSYMNIGEALVVNGGPEWEKWDKQITENLNRIQNEDGSWTGHHCITGRTFCSAAAILVLTTDRAPVPVAGKIHRR